MLPVVADPWVRVKGGLPDESMSVDRVGLPTTKLVFGRSSPSGHWMMQK
jgi:hypothetical protein